MSSTALRPLIIIAEGSSPEPLAWLRSRAEVLDIDPESAEFHEALARADGLVVRTYTRVDADLLAAAPRLKAVGRGGVGLENIDVAACRARGIEVVYTPDANTQAVAEFVVGLMVKLVRPWFENALPPFTPDHFKALRESAGEQLTDLRLGILGMGRVGRALARAAWGGFGMRILYRDLLSVSAYVDVPADSVSFERLAEDCDVLSIHVDARASNRNLINADVLRRGRFRWLINTSRGMVLDAEAAALALRTGSLQGVALDVYDPEPPLADSPYARLLEEFPDRVLLTPHMASRTHRALENMSWVVRDVISVLNGRAPDWPAPR